ncbi:MAG TPA: CoA pyrophosphatase [Stellaceae bacterium]|nr:CoA pyrophosphatase [Stellaceae bacterium]
MRERFRHLTAGRRGYGTDRDGWLPEPAMRGDHSLTPGAQPDDGLRMPAAVLVPLVVRIEGLTVLLTQRTEHLADHPGQVAFPGGRVEPSDPDAAHTALREAEEEVGLPADHVSVIGRLDTYVTGTGYEITPVVGLVRAPYPMRLDPHEVADVFEVPLAFVLDPRNHERRSREVKGRTRNYYVLPFPGRFIWGATAGMLVNLAEVLS